jgi:uncharacterized protein YigA (DUF484 family)
MSEIPDKAQIKAASIEEQAIRDYLREHPDFFDQHPDILDHLEIRHGNGTTVSLVERQVSVLRDRNMDMRKRLNNLMDNARDNDRLFKLTRELILSLLEAENCNQIASTFLLGLAQDFGVEHANIIFYGNPDDSTEECRIESPETARRELGALIKGDKAVCGALRKDELEYLFPGAGSTIGSAALISLHGKQELGLIAVGSSDPDYYRSNMGTLFLSHIADVLVRLLPKLPLGDG